MTFHDTMTNMVGAGRREDGLTKMIESRVGTQGEVVGDQFARLFVP
jgi:hypothetical protein